MRAPIPAHTYTWMQTCSLGTNKLRDLCTPVLHIHWTQACRERCVSICSYPCVHVCVCTSITLICARMQEVGMQDVDKEADALVVTTTSPCTVHADGNSPGFTKVISELVKPLCKVMIITTTPHHRFFPENPKAVYSHCYPTVYLAILHSNHSTLSKISTACWDHQKDTDHFLQLKFPANWCHPVTSSSTNPMGHHFSNQEKKNTALHLAYT